MNCLTKISVALNLLIFLMICSIQAQEPRMIGRTAIPLENMLKPDGTLDLAKGYSGSLDPKGWHMMQGKNGEPIFEKRPVFHTEGIYVPDEAAAGENDNWDDGFAFPGPGLNDYVSAIAMNGSDVYVGGGFTQAGSIVANYIAKWDGSGWHSFGSGLSGRVGAIATNETDVYVGGYFDKAGDVVVNNIAKWDGNSWSSLGSGITGSVSVLTINGSDVYVGGEFTQAGGMPVKWLARWDGSAWSSLGNGVNGTVSAIAVSGSDLYVGGYFTQAGGIDANHIAKWNGVAWSSLGSGVNGHVQAVSISGSDVYVGGDFTQAGSVNVNNIAKWDGSTWSSLGEGLPGNGAGVGVEVITVSGSNVYAGGWFTQAGGMPVKWLARWDGSAWSSLGDGIWGKEEYWVRVHTIFVSGNDVYVGGKFSEAGDVVTHNIAKWNGSAWSSLGNGFPGNGLSGAVGAIAISENDIYIGGFFTQVGLTECNHIARWDGVVWSSLGDGLQSGGIAGMYVADITVSGSNVYAGGLRRLVVYPLIEWLDGMEVPGLLWERESRG